MSVAKLRELKRLFQIIKTPSVIFLRKNDSPLKDGAEVQIEFDIVCGQGQALSLRYNIKFNFIITVSRYISANFPLQCRAVACCRRQITTNQRLQTIILYRRGELCSPVFVCYELAGDRRSPLRINVFFNLTTHDHRQISENLLGRSKPLPYRVGY